MPNKEHMLARHVAHLERLEYELGLFSSPAFETTPAELKVDLAQHVRQALEGEREIVALLTRLERTFSGVVDARRGEPRSTNDPDA